MPRKRPADKIGPRWSVSVPTRVDIAGGTLDIFPLEAFVQPALTVNAAIEMRVEASLRRLPHSLLRVTAHDQRLSVSYPSVSHIPASGGALPLLAAILRHHHPKSGFFLETRSSVPKGSGLGGSSALAVAVFRLLEKAGRRRPLPASRLILALQTLESRVIEAPTGVQDYYPALYGGVEVLWHEDGEVRRENLPGHCADFLQRSLVLAYTGQSRLSARTNWNVFKAVFENRGGARRNLARIAEAALRAREALLKGDVNWLAEAVAMEWKARRKLARGIATARMDALERAAARAGALAAKACGAGGGGCMIFVCAPGKRRAVSQALQRAGARIMFLRIARRGLLVRRNP